MNRNPSLLQILWEFWQLRPLKYLITKYISEPACHLHLKIPHFIVVLTVPLVTEHVRLPLVHFRLPVGNLFHQDPKVAFQTKVWDNFSHISKMSSIMKYTATANSFTVSANTISCSSSRSSVHENNLLVLSLGSCSPVSVSFETKLVFMLLSRFLGQFKNCHIRSHIPYSLAISHVPPDTSKLKSRC